MSTADYLGSFAAWTIGILAVSSTTYDFCVRKLKLEPKEIFKAFSVTANLEQLMNINKSKSVIHCIDGMKAISAVLIVIGHRKNMVKAPWTTWDPWQQNVMSILSVFAYCVVTFFTCSGILISQSMLRALNRGSLNLAKVYIYRFFRIIPVYGLLVLFFLTSDSPGNGVLSHFKAVCSTEWKKALMLYQNFNKGNFCFDHAWYLSTDFQLFLLSPFVIGFLNKFHRNGIAGVFAIIFVLQVHRFNELRVNPSQPWYWNYVETHFRLGEFLIGIVTGYLIYNEEVCRKIEKILEKNGIIPLALWFLSIGFFWFHIFKAPLLLASTTFRLIYSSIERELWASSICWIVFACHRLKSGGIIRSFLSHPAWQPLSKLTLSIYLLHMPYLYYTTEYYPSAYGFLWMAHIHVGDIFLAVFAAVLAYVLVEAPVGKVIDLAWNSMKSNENLKQLDGGEKQFLIRKEKSKCTEIQIHSYSEKK